MRLLVLLLVGCTARPLALPGAPGAADLAVGDAPRDGASPPHLVASTCCGEELNTSAPTDDACVGTTIAWAYVPGCSFLLARVELHSTGGPVAILDSSGERPGPALFSGVLPTGPDAAWVGADVVPPLPLAAGHRYFIEEPPGVCSIAASGSQAPYYGNQGSGWDGPYRSWAWTARLIGACAP